MSEIEKIIDSVIMNDGFARSQENGCDVTCIEVSGLYSLCIGYDWMIENKKRLSAINRWLKENGWMTRFVEA